MSRWSYYRLLALAAVLLTLVVIGVGAYVRLSNAGLSCPGWPACYGHLVVPTGQTAVARIDRTHPARPLRPAKAEKEMVHRYLAGTLGLLILALALLSLRRTRREAGRPLFLPWLAAVLVVFQALLGMWTVTLLLDPAVVAAHLFGAMAILVVLALLVAREGDALGWRGEVTGRWPRRLALLVLAVLIGQMFLGVWTSTHYAWVACRGFPACRGSLWPRGLDFREVWHFWPRIGPDYQGGTWPWGVRAAVYLLHRYGGIFTFVVILAFVGALLRASRHRGLRRLAWTVAVLTVLQVAIGIAMAVYGVGLDIADAHTVVAALLLTATVLLVYALWTPPVRARGAP
ncbi:MAG: COX15/CtaA family protein [Gammaproteobacteria bacterium]|nr:COX15/CtaA family protein [Gammaproteobacteria bacterium]